MGYFQARLISMILKNGFSHCGTVFMSDGAKRYAYEWVGESDGF